MAPLELPTLKSLSQHPFVWLVIGIAIVVHFIMATQGLPALSLLFMPSTLPELLQIDAIWRLWSPTVVHYTLLHLLTNLYLWWLFASKIEAESRIVLLLLIGISAALSNAAQWWYLGPHFGGLSGVTYALLAYLWVLERYAEKPQYKIESSLVIFLLVSIPLLATGIFGQYANVAHIVGLLSGGALAVIHCLAYGFVPRR